MSRSEARQFSRRQPRARGLSFTSSIGAACVRADEYVAAFQASLPSARVCCIPVLSIGPTPGSDALLAAELEGMGSRDLLALTSQHGAAAVKKAHSSSERVRLATEAAGADGRVFAVGAKTARSLPDGVAATGLPAGTGRVLATHIVSKVGGQNADTQPRGRVLYPCGETRRPELEAALEVADVAVVPLPVYASTQRSPKAIQADLDTVLTRSVASSGLCPAAHGERASSEPAASSAAVAAADAHVPENTVVLCFFSPRGVEAAFRTASVARRCAEAASDHLTVWAAIGTTTAKALECKAVTGVLVSPAPGPAELAAAVAAAVSREPAA